jgi:hypothetical protein
MKDALAVALAALLVCSLPAMAVPGGTPVGHDGPQAVGAPDEEWIEPADDPVANGVDTAGIDVSATLDNDAIRLESRYETHRLDARLDRADSDAERRAIIREETAALSDTVEELRERERDAYRAYADGEIGERELLIELATVHATGVVLEEAVEGLVEHAEGVPDAAAEDEFEAMAVETETVQGPVREQVVDALRGETDRTRVYVESDGGGIVLASVGDGSFHREADVVDARDPAGEPVLESLGDSEERIAELYPEIFADARWSYSEVGHGVHRSTGEYSAGTITVYIDQSTADVFREHLTVGLDEVETTPLGSETEDDARLAVEGSTPGGPLVISLDDASADVPLSGQITVDGTYVGETDDEGELWVVAPREEVTITAVVGSTTIELTVDASELEPDTEDDEADEEDEND